MRHLALLVAIGALAGCASIPATSPAESMHLPERPEPQYQVAAYESLPDKTQMVVRWTTNQLTSQMKAKLPGLSTSRIVLNLVQEDLVTYLGQHYRRAWFDYKDLSQENMHGYCGQGIYVWLHPSGAIADIFVTPTYCPL